MTFRYRNRFPLLSRPLQASALVLAALVAAHAQAAPSGGEIVGGSGSIGQTGNETTITQDSHRLAINWDSFNVASDETVRFIQPGQNAIALNRILSNDASQIFGQLQANGHVVLVNPNGVLFGEGATIDVGGLVASGLDISVADFIDGELRLQAGDGNGVVINRGLINAAAGGNVVMIGQQVVNEGIIEADLGSVALAAGKAAVLTFEPNGLIGVRVTEAMEQSLLGDDPAVANSGEVRARSGRILLTASASADVFSQAVNTGDLAYESEVLIHEDGSFTLGKGADVVTNGSLISSAIYAEGGEPAVHSSGSIAVMGENARISGSVWASDSDEAGGPPAAGADVVLLAKNNLTMDQGHISIGSENRALAGGDELDTNEVILLGQTITLENSSIFSSNRLTVQIGGQIDANGIDATTHINIDESSSLSSWGDTHLDIWASESVVINGRLEAPAYEGGNVQITSLGTLGFGGHLSAYGYGSYGDVLLQAEHFQITESATPTSIGEVAFERLMSSSNLTLRAQGDIEFGTAGRGVAIAVSNTSLNDQTLTLEAGGDLLLSGSYVRLNNVSTALSAGGLVMIDNSRLLAPGSALSITAAGAIDTVNSGTVDAGFLTLNPYTDPLSIGGPAEVALPLLADRLANQPPVSSGSSPAPANPPIVAGLTGGNIIGGTGSITQVGKETTIVQDSHRLAVNWNTFDIAADERVQFIQPGTDSIALNRILSCDATRIVGQLDANGHVLLANPNGIIFGKNATVDVGGLVASGLDVKPTHFMAGDLAFSAQNGGKAVVRNNGIINAAEGGNVVLLGKRLDNTGEINADYGNVALAAGQAAVLTVEPNGLMGVRVTKATSQKALGATPAVANSGEIVARHGRILLTASASQNPFRPAVSSTEGAHESEVLVHSDAGFTLGHGARLVNTGSIEAGRHPGDDSIDAGNVVLLGGDIFNSGVISADTGFLLNSGDVVLAASGKVRMEGDGVIRASGWGASEGGTVALLGKDIEMVDRSRIDVGEIGNVIIGARAAGDNSQLRDTETVLLGDGTSVQASGRYWGGTVRSWSKNSTEIGAHLSVVAPASGSIEFITEGALGFTGSAALYSEGREGGRPGSLLLQAANLSVTAEQRSASIHDESLNSALRWGHVTLRSHNDIVLGGSTLITGLVADAPRSPSGADETDARSLTLEAARDVVFDNVFIASPTLDLTVSAGGNVTFENVRLRADRYQRGLTVSAGNDVEFLDSTITWPWPTFIEAGGVVSNQNSSPFAEHVDFGAETEVVLDDTGSN